MKPHNSGTDASTKAHAEGWLTIGSTGDRLYWDHAEDLLFSVRRLLDGRFEYESINPAFEALLGLSSRAICDVKVSDCLTRRDAKSVCDALQACIAVGGEVRIRHSLTLGGIRRRVETTVAPILDPVAGAVDRVIGSHRILNEASLENARANVRGSTSLASIQEDVQQRIASDLHDSTCQHLIAASLGLMRVRACLADRADVESICDGIDAAIDEALKEVRSFAYLLHPPNLMVAGLKATIEHYAEGFAARTSLRVSTKIVADVDRLSEQAQHALLRITQEGLTNVFRHAKATEVDIVVDASGGYFRLRISDNGRGLCLDTQRGGKTRSFGIGILAMRARLAQFGGTLDIRSSTSKGRSGTVLCALLPQDLPASGRVVRPARDLKARTGVQ